MRGLITWGLGIIFPLLAQGQNLVPNAGFETFSSCPSSYGELEKAVPWNKPTAGTTDYFNACAPSSSPVCVPNNFAGGYQPARGGDGYVGFTTYKSTYPDYREYIQATLTSPLQASACYLAELFVNKKNNAGFSTDNMGIHLRQGPKTTLSSTYLDLIPQISSPQGVMLEDTLDWVAVNGYYNAIGGEDHILIGNFRSDAQTNWSVSNPYSNELYAYYYIDDVSLTLVDNSIELGPDTLLCSGASLTLDIRLPDASYAWNDGLNSGIRVITAPGTYAVKVYIGQCNPLEDSIRVSYIKPPSIDLGPDTSICMGQSVMLDAATPFATYLWHNGFEGPDMQVKEDGTYWVSVANPCGTDQDTVRFEYMVCENLLWAPNAFSPDGDGVNDYFQIKGAGIEQFELLIYDRWGRLIYRSEDPNAHWDGSSGGSAYPNGIYHWIATYTGGGFTRLEKENRKQGFVYLIR